MTQPNKGRNLLLVGSLSALTLVLIVAGAKLAKRDPGEVQQSASVSLKQSAPADVRYMVPVSSSQPAQGSSTALATIVVWCELRGDACHEIDAPLQALLEKYPGEVRWVFRQLPDMTRKDAALVHYFARGAHLQAGKFWDVRRELASVPPDQQLTESDLEGISEKLGLDWSALQTGIRDHAFAQYVGVDVVFAKKFGVDRTPYLFVNGRPVAPAPASELAAKLEPMIMEERELAKQHLHSGVSADKIYSKIIEDGLWSVGDDPQARQGARAAADKSKAQGH